MPKFNPPENLNFSNPGQWPEWKQRFQRYRTATKLFEEEGNVQVSSLIYAMGIEAEHVFRSFTFEREIDADNYNIVLNKFEEHFVPKRNVIHERARFHQLCQRQGESVEVFIRSLYELAEICDFGRQKNEHIRDRLVVGINDKDLSEKLQLKADLELDEAIQIVRQSELVKSQIKAQGQGQVSESTDNLEDVTSK